MGGSSLADGEIELMVHRQAHYLSDGAINRWLSIFICHALLVTFMGPNLDICCCYFCNVLLNNAWLAMPKFNVTVAEVLSHKFDVFKLVIIELSADILIVHHTWPEL